MQFFSLQTEIKNEFDFRFDKDSIAEKIRFKNQIPSTEDFTESIALTTDIPYDIYLDFVTPYNNDNYKNGILKKKNL